MSELKIEYELYLGPNQRSYNGIELIERTGTLIRFKWKETEIISTHPYTLRISKSLTCGHDLSNYYEEDGGNAGVWPHCKECDKNATS